MHIQQGRQFVRRVLGQVLLHTGDFFSYRIAGHAHAGDFFIGSGVVNKVMRDISAARCHQHGTANRDTSRNG